MGGGFLGPFVAGISGSLQQAQQRQTEQEYKKALVEHSKLQTKLLENKLNLADQEQGMMRAYLSTKGIQLPPPVAPAQIAQPEQQSQSLLGRLFNPQPPAMQPAATQPPLAQTIAQSQMEGQIPGMQAKGQPDEAFMEDLLQKKMFDMPPFRQRLEAESKQIGRTVTTMGPNGPMTVLLDKMGRPMGSMPTVPEYGSIKSKGMQGEEYEQFYPKTSPPGFGGNGPGGIMISPPPQMIPQGMPEAVKQKVTDLEIFKNQMQGLKNMGQNPKVFGLWANTAAKIADSPVGALMPADPDVLAFHKAIKNIENIKVHQFGGSNLTSTELARALASLPRTYNQQDFNTAVNQTIKAADADIKDYYKAYAQPEAMKGVQGGLGPRPQMGIPQGYQYGGTKNGKPYYINPNASPDKRIWVP